MAQILEVIEFTVVDDDQSAISAPHGLVAASQIDDAQAPVPQRRLVRLRVLGDGAALVIRPTVGQSVGHGAQ